VMDAVKAYADKWAECDAIRREIKDELYRVEVILWAGFLFLGLR